MYKKETNDQYYTPKELAKTLTNEVVTLFGKGRTYLEPSGGTGVFVDALKQLSVTDVISYDINPKHPDVIEALIQYPTFDPSYKHNQLIRWASSNGHINLVRKLMEDPRVDPSDLNNAAFYPMFEAPHRRVYYLQYCHHIYLLI